jgi:hypothetical protein
MAKKAGSLWVDGTTLHYVDKVGVEWFFTGTAGSTPAGAKIGSLWIDDSTSTMHYIDGSGVDRAVKVSAVADRSGVGALKGSFWVETTANTNYSLHGVDNVHVEQAAHDDTHGDVAHSDVAASHNDVAASHSDVAHADGGHNDVAHSDVASHADCAHHDYHFDGNISDFDAPGHHDWNPYSDHEDWPHGDGSHADVGHTDHEDAPAGSGTTGGGLTPSAFGGYTDSHGDCTAGGHSDTAHGDAGHTDAAHSDSSTAHSDSTVAHTDVAHNDQHTDQPTSLGA